MDVWEGIEANLLSREGMVDNNKMMVELTRLLNYKGKLSFLIGLVQWMVSFSEVDYEF
jgi:hypothetical protein